MENDMNKTDHITRIPRLFKVVLGLSLALNLLVIGVIVGAGARGGGPMRGAGLTNYAMPYVKALPGEDRRAIFKRMRRDGVPEMPDRKQRRALYFQMVSVLEADSFDKVAAEAILKQQGTTSVAAMTAAQTAWIEHVSEMDDAARQAYAVDVQQVLERRHKHKKPKQ